MAGSGAIVGGGVHTDFTLCGTRVSVLRYEGSVQLCFWQPEAELGKQRVFANRFCSTETARELRVLSDHLEKLTSEGAFA